MTNTIVSLEKIHQSDIENFKKELQESFAVGVINEFGNFQKEPIPSNYDLDTSINSVGSVTLRILCNGQKIGGAVVTINDQTHHNTLDLFFLKIGQEGNGFGYKAWCAIEQQYPATISWQTHTPYFEKRNIHFYVNKCGFKIIEFFNRQHKYPDEPTPNDLPDNDGFLFEKIMTK